MEIWYLIGLFVFTDLLILFYILFYRRRGLSPQERQKYLEHWRQIKMNPDQRYAVMEADKLLDILLRKKGYSGSVGGKLKGAAKLFSDLDGVWTAHKLRNKIAHELEFHPSHGEISSAMKGFERAFKDLGLS